jgi:hypothetical protein
MISFIFQKTLVPKTLDPPRSTPKEIIQWLTVCPPTPLASDAKRGMSFIEWISPPVGFPATGSA